MLPETKRQILYRPARRDELVAFFDRWMAEAAKTLTPWPACIEVDWWGRADRYFVAEDEQRIVGAAACRAGSPSYLDLVAVAPDLERRGIGSGLVNHILHELVKAGCVPVLCEIANDDIRRLIEKSRYAAHVRYVGEE